jgi:hypothetical protein
MTTTILNRRAVVLLGGLPQNLHQFPGTYSFPHTTLPVTRASPGVSMSVIVPPASRSMIRPAAMSQDYKLRSQ